MKTNNSHFWKYEVNADIRTDSSCRGRQTTARWSKFVMFKYEF